MTASAGFPPGSAPLRSIEVVVLWFLGTVSVAVWFVFRDDRLDHRVLALGAVAPDVVDGVTGGVWVAHSVTASVVLLAVVMALTVGRRESRKRWLALPIGTFLHLVFDGAFADTGSFWWPFTGIATSGGALPSIARGWWNIPLEIVGLALLAFVVSRHGLADPARRREFVRTGRLTDPNPGGVGQC